jgi:sarcosine oxidase
MSISSYDVIVVGVGGVGSAVLDQLASRGRRVLGLDRFPPGHDRGSSHGQTRIIRQAYYEHPDYVPLVLRAYELWRELEARRGRTFFHDVGLLQVGRPEGKLISGVLASAHQHKLDVQTLTPAEVEQRFPGFRAAPDTIGVFERVAGYLDVEACTIAHAEEAQSRGAELHVGEEVRAWRPLGSGAANQGIEVETDRGRYEAGALVVTAGAWAGSLLADLRMPLEVLRKPLFWFKTKTDQYRVDRGCPCYLFETPEGGFYGFPDLEPYGLKCAEHSGGAVVADPLRLDRELNRDDQLRVDQFIADHLPGVSQTRTHHAVCMYTVTPDTNFVIDRHPQYPQVVFAAGLSGHGYKFTPMLGEALADLALEGKTKLPVEFLSRARLELGRRQ